ncbi:MAG: MBL fold metallo-hydrolase [Spirochaetes bacterium]|nr:MBL fold metallo-hydrolase [Spirochaetota bacterium]
MIKNLKVYRFNEDALPLSNNGELTLYFLGCGSAFAKTLYQNNLVIIKGNTSIFVDFGNRAPEALAKVELNVSNIDNLILTHSHADHIGGVEEIALMNRYFYKRKPRLYITEKYKDILWNESLAGGCKYSEKKEGKYLEIEDFFEVVYPKKIKLNYDFKEDRDVSEIEIGSINIIFYRTKHIPSGYKDLKDFQISYGLLIDKRIIFTSDTIFDSELLDILVKNFEIDAIFHDCQFFPGGVHASYEELKTLSDNIKSKIFLMHYGDNYSTIIPEKDGFAGFVKQNFFYSFL